MILQGNQRGGSKDLALHLLKTENEHVDVYELRGFVSDNLVSALNEAYAISRGTKAKQFLFSLSLNPPPEENVSTEVFLNAIERVERELGLTDQPRGIIFHEKEGRRHGHAVWSRIDGETMKAIPLPYTKYKLRDISRELYIEHGWDMPRGFMNSKERDPTNFTLDQWQQAKRIGKDPREIKTALQDCWAISDTQGAFQQALKERGLTLAKGDRRGFVALDHRCEAFSIAKWVGIRAKDVKSKLTDQSALPSVDEARQQIANDMTARLKELQQQQQMAINNRLASIEYKRLQLVKAQQANREQLAMMQKKRWQAEVKARQDRFNKGLRGLFDRLTGEHSQIKKRNELEAIDASKRDQKERDHLIFDQLAERRALNQRNERLKEFKEQRQQILSKDVEQYKEVQQRKREVVDFKQRMQSRSRAGPERER